MVREHPLGKMAERTVGRVAEEPKGGYKLVGLEGAFSQYLEGEAGQRLKQKIAGGQWKPINDVNEKEPTEGYNVHYYQCQYSGHCSQCSIGADGKF